MSRSQTAIAAAVEQAAHVLGHEAGERQDAFRLRQRLPSRNSLVFFYDGVTSGASGIVAKLIHGAQGGQLAESEARRLRDLATHFRGGDGLRVPRLLACDPVHGIVVTEEVGGVRLDVLLRQALHLDRPAVGDAMDRAVVACARAGRWLARLHEIEIRSVADVRPFLIARLDAAIERLAAIRITTWELERIRAYFLSVIDTDSGARPVLHHPDYSPYNVIVCDGGICVLDHSEVDVGHPAEAASFWWAHFEWLRLLPWIAHTRTAALQDVFLDALATGPLEPAWKRWGVVQRLSYMTDVPASGRHASARDWWQRFWRRRLMRWLRKQEWTT